MGANARQWNSTLPQRKKGLSRSSFKTKPGALKRAPFVRSSREVKSTKPFSRSLGKGKKTKAWDAARAKLKIVFERAGITTCEIRCNGCWRDDGLGFAHSLKRRNITTDAQMEEVALACNHCHDIIEAMPESRMGDIVRAVIGVRPRSVESIFKKSE